MGEPGQFSDDISALWGPDETGVLEPAPLRRAQPGEHAETAPVPVKGNDDRMRALERQVKVLLDANDVLTRRLIALEGGLRQSVARVAESRAATEQAVDGRIAALDQRIDRLAELLESHRAQSVMGWELESLRTELLGAVRAQLDELRSGLANSTEAEAERRRLEASWQQSMPGF